MMDAYFVFRRASYYFYSFFDSSVKLRVQVENRRLNEFHLVIASRQENFLIA